MQPPRRPAPSGPASSTSTPPSSPTGPTPTNWRICRRRLPSASCSARPSSACAGWRIDPAATASRWTASSTLVVATASLRRRWRSGCSATASSSTCCPRPWPDTAHRTRPATRRQRRLHRTMASFRDVRWSDAVPAAPARTALIAKHLCGSGVDEVLRQLEAQNCLPRIFVLVPCCFHKITLDGYCNVVYLRQVMGIDSEEALARVSRLTDWNMSFYQSNHERMLARIEAARRSAGTNGKERACEAHLPSEAAAAAFCYQRRSGPRSIANSIPCTHAFAQLVEGLLNYGRMQWLRQRRYDVQLVQYVPDVVTPKNKCVIATRQAPTK
ncbi:putative Methyltransferase TRM13 [Leishmania utingensis]|uniref:tRNA:m(4)X modification enzyme TRM13 n=1 Tax=Leishmania utingensis TaxID=653362 RepID=A0AAW3AFU5_9TRYP